MRFWNFAEIQFQKIEWWALHKTPLVLLSQYKSKLDNIKIPNSCGSMTDWEFFAHIGFPQQLQLRSFPLWFVKKILYIHPTKKYFLYRFTKSFVFSLWWDFCELFSKMFYIQENVAGCKFWWVETTITRRDKVFWEKESQMRGRRGSILGWHIWRFSFLLCALCIELKHCPFFFLFFNLHYQRRAKNKTWVKWQKRGDILSIDYNMFPSCVETISFWKKVLQNLDIYTLKTANISRQNVGFCAASAIWASRVSFIIRLLLLQPSFSSSLRHKRPAVRSTRSVNINHTLRTLSSFEGNKISKCTFASWLLNDRTVLWH